ncbi:MAG: hypothetical protein U0M21_00680, partial [Emergencia sp.]|nr:hypothetical protein [Emergencia sp.]
MGQKVGDIDLGLRVNAGPFKTQMNGIQKLASKAGKTLAAAFAVKGLIQFSSECLKLGSDLAEVQNVTDTVFPNMKERVNQFAKEAMNTAGLSETMAKKFTGTFGAMASSFGFSEKEAYNMSTTLTKLSGDVASFYNISQDEAYTKLKSVFTGETETLKELGIVMTQNALDAYAMSNGYGKLTNAMTEAEKVSLRYAFVQSQLTHAAGDFARTADSWANQVRVLSLQFESLKANIGQGLINVLSPVLKWINMLIAKVVAASEAFRKFTERLTGKKQQPITVKETAAGMETVSSGANTATKAVGGTNKAVKKLKRELAGFDQITKLTDNSETGGGDSAATASPTGGSSGASVNTGSVSGNEKEVTKLSGAYKKLAESFDRLKKSFKGFADLCTSAGKWVLDNVLKPLGKWTLNKLAPKIFDALAAAFDALTSAGKALQPLWQWLWDNFFSKIAKFTGGVIIKFLEMLTSGLEKLSAWIDKHPKLFSGIVTGLLGLKAVEKVSGPLNILRAAMKKSGGSVSGFLTEIGNIAKIKGKFEKFGPIIAKVTGPFNKLRAAFKDGGGTISGMLKEIGKLSSLKGKFGKLGSIFEKVTGPFNKFRTAFKNGGGLVGAFGKIKTAAGILLNGLKGVGAFFMSNPIVLGIAAVVAAGVLIYKNWDKICEMAAKLKKKVVDTFNSIVSKIKEVPKKIKEFFKGKIDGVAEWFGSIKDAFVNTLSKLGDKLPDLSKVGEKISSAVGTVKAKISAWFADKKKNISKKWNKLTKEVKEKKAELKAEIKQKWKDLKGKWKNIVENVEEKRAELKAEIKQKWSNLKSKWNAIIDNIKEKKAELKAEIKQKWSNLKDKWNSIVGNIKDKTAELKAKIGTTWSNLKDKWNSIVSNIKDKTAEMKAKVGTTWSSLKDKWNSIVGNIKSKTAEMKAKVG